MATVNPVPATNEADIKYLDSVQKPVDFNNLKIPPFPDLVDYRCEDTPVIQREFSACPNSLILTTVWVVATAGAAVAFFHFFKFNTAVIGIGAWTGGSMALMLTYCGYRRCVVAKKANATAQPQANPYQAFIDKQNKTTVKDYNGKLSGYLQQFQDAHRKAITPYEGSNRALLEENRRLKEENTQAKVDKLLIETPQELQQKKEALDGCYEWIAGELTKKKEQIEARIQGLITQERLADARENKLASREPKLGQEKEKVKTAEKTLVIEIEKKVLESTKKEPIKGLALIQQARDRKKLGKANGPAKLRQQRIALQDKVKENVIQENVPSQKEEDATNDQLLELEQIQIKQRLLIEGAIASSYAASAKIEEALENLRDKPESTSQTEEDGNYASEKQIPGAVNMDLGAIVEYVDSDETTT